jgi:hypothetical protein
MSDLRNRLWDDEQHPYLPFMFAMPFFGGAMERFEPFDISMLIEGSRGWHLPHDTGKSWKVFEKALRMTAEALAIYFSQNHADIQPIWALPEKPSNYGYFNVHETKNDAYNAALNSIDAFVVYTAYLTFLIGLCQTCATGWSCPSIESLFNLAKVPVHPEWQRNLLSSGIGNFNPPRRRVGAVINISWCKWRNLIPYMIKLNVPLWFYWGIPPFPVQEFTGSWVSSFLPNRHPQPPDEGGHTTMQPPTTKPLTIPGFPQVQPYSGQCQGELMREFLERRDKENHKLELKEAPMDKQRRLSRATHNKKKACPGRKGAKVFRWEVVDGFRIRIEVSRGDAPNWFERYKKHEIIYDSFSNQFDCCSDFEDGLVQASSDDDDEYHSDLHHKYLQQSPRTTFDPEGEAPSKGRMSLPALPSASSAMSSTTTRRTTSPVPEGQPKTGSAEDSDKMDIDEGNEEEMDLFEASKQDVIYVNPIAPVQEPPPETQFIEDLVYYRYGFTLSESPYEPAQNVPVVLKHWSTVCCAVGGQRLISSAKENQEPIMDFLNTLLSVDQPWHDVPARYWDLSPWNNDCLNKLTSHFRIELKFFVGKDPLCLLHPRGIDPSKCPSWILAVSPMTALECIRRGLGPDPCTVAQYLVENGMAFRTLRRLESRPQTFAQQRSTRPTLGKRTVHHKFDLADFATYETLKESYLCSHENARRALSFGGITARLAREVLDFSLILRGPSEAALEGKQDVLISGEEVFVDDSLSVEVLDFICGTYERDTSTISMYIFFLKKVYINNFIQIKQDFTRGFPLTLFGVRLASMLVTGTLSVRIGTLVNAIRLSREQNLWQLRNGENR